MRLIAVFGMAFALVSAGCGYFYDQIGETKRIPYPVPETFPAEIEGQFYRVWMGNELQIKSGIHTAYILLQGVNNPDRGDTIEAKAIEQLRSLLNHPTICLLYTSPSPRDQRGSRMPSSA